MTSLQLPALHMNVVEFLFDFLHLPACCMLEPATLALFELLTIIEEMMAATMNHVTMESQDLYSCDWGVKTIFYINNNKLYSDPVIEYQ